MLTSLNNILDGSKNIFIFFVYIFPLNLFSLIKYLFNTLGNIWIKKVLLKISIISMPTRTNIEFSVFRNTELIHSYLSLKHKKKKMRS